MAMNLNIIAQHRPHSAPSTSVTNVALSRNDVVTSAIYVRFQATSTGGSTLGASNSRLMSLTVATPAGCSLSLLHTAVAGEIQMDFFGGGISAGGNSGVLSVSPVAGDTVEVVIAIDTAAFTATITAYKNGTLIGTSTSVPWTSGVPTTYGDGGSSPKLWVNQLGSGLATNAQAMYAVCYAQGAASIADFRSWFLGVGNAMFGGM